MYSVFSYNELNFIGIWEKGFSNFMPKFFDVKWKLVYSWTSTGSMILPLFCTNGSEKTLGLVRLQNPTQFRSVPGGPHCLEL